MSYVIAAYAIVLGTLLVYGGRLHAQRRALEQREALEEVPVEARTRSE
jgi:hypothetical protein